MLYDYAVFIHDGKIDGMLDLHFIPTHLKHMRTAGQLSNKGLCVVVVVFFI